MVELVIKGDSNSPTPESNELDRNAMGGTELLKHELYRRMPPELLNEFQIICSRVRDIQDDKLKVLWLHDLPGDPESAHLADGGWKKFDKLVFVSHWQQQQYANFLGVPYDAGVVIRNAINPFEEPPKFAGPDDTIKLIYTSTPHRGLNLLYAAFEHMTPIWEERGIDVELDVFSSFKLYGWEERDKPYEELFDKLRAHDKINYHGTVSNDEIRTALQEAHIFTYPSTWQETSCLCLMEAMAAGLQCVHSSLAALPETSAFWTMMYDFAEDQNTHVNRFVQYLINGIDITRDEQFHLRLRQQAAYANSFFSWNIRQHEWRQLLEALVNAKRS